MPYQGRQEKKKSLRDEMVVGVYDNGGVYAYGWVEVKLLQKEKSEVSQSNITVFCAPVFLFRLDMCVHISLYSKASLCLSSNPSFQSSFFFINSFQSSYGIHFIGCYHTSHEISQISPEEN